MPHWPLEAPGSQCDVGLLQQANEPSEVTMAVRAQRWLQLCRVPPAGDQVRVGVLFPSAGAEQVIDQPVDSGAARVAYLPDHGRNRLQTSSAAASRRSTLRRHSAA